MAITIPLCHLDTLDLGLESESDLSYCDGEDAAFRERDWKWREPVENWRQAFGEGKLRARNEQGQARGGGQESEGGGEGFGEALDGAEGDEGGGGGGEGFGAGGEYIDSGQCKSADDLAEEGDFLVVGFDEGDAGLGRPKLHGESREAGAGTDVDEVIGDGGGAAAVSGADGSGVAFFCGFGHGRAQVSVQRTDANPGHRGFSGWLRSVADGSVRTGWEEVAGGEEGLPEVTSDDLSGSANRGEIDAGVPAEK